MKIVVHIGLAKAGSTYLEKHVFNRLHETNPAVEYAASKRLLRLYAGRGEMQLKEAKIELESILRSASNKIKKRVSRVLSQSFTRIHIG